MNYFINDSVHVESKARALEVARKYGSEISIYDACGLWRVIDKDSNVIWERR